MSINETIDFFNGLLGKSDNKSEIRLYKIYIAILSDLSKRDFTTEENLLINKELDSLNLKELSEIGKKFFRKKLIRFKKYLKQEHGLITEGHYTEKGIALGMTLGISLGISLGAALGLTNRPSDGISYGLVIGMLIGMIVGRTKDAEAKKQGRVLRTKLD